MHITGSSGKVNPAVLRFIALVLLVVIAVIHYQYQKQVAQDQALRERYQTGQVQGNDGTAREEAGGKKRQAVSNPVRDTVSKPAPATDIEDDRPVRRQIVDKLNQARSLQHAGMIEDVPASLDAAADLARRLPPGDLNRITAFTEIGRIHWLLGNKKDSESWTRAAYDEIRVRLAPSLSATPQQTYVPWSVSEAVYSQLGMIELDRGASARAVEWYERARRVTENAPETGPADRSVKAGSIMHNYLNLGRAYCQADDIENAHEYLERLHQACTKLVEPGSVLACIDVPPC